jgi:hypothetical protein
MAPDSMIEWVLLCSALPGTILALLIFAIPPLDRFGIQVLTQVLGFVCATPIPTFWCRIPLPVPWLAVVQAAAYVVFLLMSIYFIARIGSGDYQTTTSRGQCRSTTNSA